jgi:RNase P subunit RPR2
LIKVFCRLCDSLLFFGELNPYMQWKKKFATCTNCGRNLEFEKANIDIDTR